MFFALTKHPFIKIPSGFACWERQLVRKWLLRFVMLGFLGCFVRTVAAGNNPAADQLLNLSIEELMNVKVTSVSRRPQKLSEVASAVFVITQDDIRRSGATSIRMH